MSNRHDWIVVWAVMFLIAAVALPGCGKDERKILVENTDSPRGVGSQQLEQEKGKTAKDAARPVGDKDNDSAAKPLTEPELLVELPDHCNTPDGMTVLADGSIIVSVPNFNDKSAEPLLVKITTQTVVHDDGEDTSAQVSDFIILPKHPVTGRMGPMGIRAAPNGDLYLADNQLFHGEKDKLLYGQSRLMRITMKDGKPEEIQVVAKGINVANGLAIHDGYVYITETQLVPDSKPLVSGLMRFKLDEQDVKLQAAA